MKKNTCIIAEIGENHIGKIELAKQMIKEASFAGADIVKFQSYLGKDFKDEDPEKEWFHKVELSNEAHFELKRFAENHGVEFLSSPFSLERAEFLCENLGLKKIKIAAGMMLNFPVLDYVNDNAEVVFLSTGMATIPEIKEAISHLNKIKKCYILHCVTQYPCKDEDANLLAIRKLQEEFPDNEIGYSDHTIGYLAPIIAIALGAKVIEIHFTFDKNASEGTDHILSVEPHELKEMIDKIKRLETLLGNFEKKPTDSEKKIIDFVRERFK